MKICPQCSSQLADDAIFCPNCGAQFAAPNPGTPPYTPNPYMPPVDPTDHTAEFDQKDISENKVIAMLVYLMGWIGIFIALIAAGNSPYASFHVRQALKIQVLTIVAGLIGMIGSLLVLPFIAAWIFNAVLGVVKIICFFQICKGKAKEPPIVSSFGFLK